MMERLPAASGIQWIRHGFAILRRQPRELVLLYLLFVTFNLVLSAIVPPLGPIASMLLNQVVTMGFMLGCAVVDADQQAQPRMLFSYFKRDVLGKLAGLGLCYLAATVVSSSVMYFVGGEALTAFAEKANSGTLATLDPALRDISVRAIFLAMSIYGILVLPLWFAGPLIAWQNMGVAKAIFFSVFSVLRAIKAFIAYILSWATIVLFVSLNLGALATLLSGANAFFVLLLMIPCSLFLSLAYYCSFYPSYVELFGKPQFPAQE